jgi:F0F1-type ATP synthase assembly protein I
MNQNPDQFNRDRARYALNLMLVGIAGLVGLLTLIIVLVALFAGLWLDNYFNSRPYFTLGLVLGSVPVTLAVMVVLVKFITSRVKLSGVEKSQDLQEETNRGKDT